MNIGFTGTKSVLTPAQTNSLRARMQMEHDFNGVTAHSGDCVGADAVFHQIAVELGWYTVGHVPSNDYLRAFCKYSEERWPSPYLERNRHIVHAANMMFATPDSFVEKPKGGTWYTIRYARELKKPISIIFPDGTVHNE